MADTDPPASQLITPLVFTLRPGNPDFLDLPWGTPLCDWGRDCPRLEDVAKGLSRHPVVFVNYSGAIYALKELPPGVAELEYQHLLHMEEQRLPVVSATGTVKVLSPECEDSVLITRYLDRSLPYRSLFMSSGLSRYSEHLLDAISGLLVQLHLAGVYWGDCSLSNTLFRRDAGALQAYLVDAETAEIHAPRLSPTLRHHDLEIMEENVDRDLSELVFSGDLPQTFPIQETGAYIRHRYQGLWEEITREIVINTDERYRIQERIRALNGLGFSVGQVEMQPVQTGDKVRLRVLVTDRNFHRDQLMELTGLAAEEMQARQMMNEILEVQAHLSQANNRPTPNSAAAYYWLQNDYQPVVRMLAPMLASRQGEESLADPAELYCEVLEHKWYLSERARHDVGHQAATEDYLQKFGPHEST